MIILFDKDITDVNIVANKVYIICVNNQISEGGSGRSAFKSITSYPITQGDISLLRTSIKLTSSGTMFPLTFSTTDYLAGIADFKFEPQL